MSQVSRLTKVLSSKGNKTGFSAGQLAQKAGISKTAVYRRLSDIRDTYKVVTTSKTSNGRRRKFYRIAG